jgi:large subunit ribosomal protein L25
VTGKQVRKLRLEGQIPAVVYGHNKESQALTIDQKEFVTTYREAGFSTLLDLSIGDQKPQKVLIHDIQSDGPTGRVLHVDFYIVNMKEKLQTEIELEFVGQAPAVEVDGGTLITVKSELNVECLPQDLVTSIEVDISKLVTFDDVIRVSDIPVPAGMEILDEPEEVVVSVAEPRSEEEMAALDEVDTTDVTAIESETASGTDTETEGEEKSEE